MDPGLSACEAAAGCLSGGLLKSRWHIFSATLMAVAISGTSYAFGIFSEVFKDKLGFSQLELSVIGSCGSTGLYTGVFCGLGIERYGPRAVLLVGAGLIFSGNMYMWFAAQKLVAHSVPVLAIVNFIAQLGVACSSATATTVSIRSFPSEVRGRVAGLAKAYFGISAAVLASIAGGFFPSASVHFILFVAILLPTFLVVGALNVNATFFPVHIVSFSYERSRGYPVSLIPYFQHLLLLMALILITSAISHFADTGMEAGYVLSVTVALFMSGVMLLPSYYGPRLLPKSLSIDAGANEPNTPLLAGAEAAAVEKEDPILTSDRTVTVDFVSFYGRHLRVTEIMKEWRCYALMFVFSCTAGAGLFVINNVVAVAATVGQNASSFFVVILSLANGIGRMSIGVVADRMARRLSRIQLLSITALLMAGAQFLLALNTQELLYPCLFFVGLTFGAAFSNVSAIAADLFGAQHIGSNYGFIDLSPTIGSYAFATGLIAIFYPKNNGDDDGDDDDDEASCEGAHCLQGAFFVTTAACIVAAVVGLTLHVKTPINKDPK